jgi:hypothetical protein
MSRPEDPDDNPLSALRSNVENMAAWLAIWIASALDSLAARASARAALMSSHS